jgi:glycerol-3-phosphate dehydrogenase
LAADGVARLMAPVLGWDQATVDREIAHYRARLEAEAAAQALLTDAASDSARAEVRDPRLERLDERGE